MEVKEEEGKGVAFNLDYKVSLEYAPIRSILAREKKVGSMIHIHIRSHTYGQTLSFFSQNLVKFSSWGSLIPRD